MSTGEFGPTHEDLSKRSALDEIGYKIKRMGEHKTSAMSLKAQLDTENEAVEIIDDEIRAAIFEFQNEIMESGRDLPEVYRTKMLTIHERYGWANSLDKLRDRDELSRGFQLLSEHLSGKGEPTPAAVIKFEGGKGINIDVTFFDIPSGTDGLETRVKQVAGEEGIVLRHSLLLPVHDEGLRFRISEDGHYMGQELGSSSMNGGVVITGGQEKHFWLGEDIRISDKTDEGWHSVALTGGRTYKYQTSSLSNEHGQVVFIGNQAVAALAISLKYRLRGDFARTSALVKSKNKPTVEFINLIDQKYPR